MSFCFNSLMKNKNYTPTTTTFTNHTALTLANPLETVAAEYTVSNLAEWMFALSEVLIHYAPTIKQRVVLQMHGDTVNVEVVFD